jgi:hypothetical protein
MQDGDVVRIGGRDWRCISGYGHAPEHIALYCEDLKVLISGDMVLPRISTNVSVYEIEPEANRCAVPGVDRQVPAPAGRHAGAALARQAVPRPAPAHPPAARPPPRPARRSAGGLRAKPVVGGRRCCRCCSSASWTCTRPPSPWASRWRTCMRCGMQGKLRRERGCGRRVALRAA